VSGSADPTMDGLADVYRGVAEAGKAFAAGELTRAIAELSDAVILSKDLLADLERAADPEPNQ
jgi:hypothetical protein